MIDDTTKRTIKNLGEGIERAEEMPDQLVEDIEGRESNR